MHIRNESSLLRRGFLGCHAMLPQRGGSIAWHPKKLLRRRLKWKRSSQIKRTKKGAYVIVSCSRQKSYWMFTKLVAYWWLQRWKTKILKSRDEGREEIFSPLRQETNQFSQALRCCYSHQLHYEQCWPRQYQSPAPSSATALDSPGLILHGIFRLWHIFELASPHLHPHGSSHVQCRTGLAVPQYVPSENSRNISPHYWCRLFQRDHPEAQPPPSVTNKSTLLVV